MVVLGNRVATFFNKIKDFLNKFEIFFIKNGSKDCGFDDEVVMIKN